VARSRDENAREARFVTGELSRRGITFIPTVTNFVLIRTTLGGEDLHQRLLTEGVIVRPMEAYGYQDAVRVSFGTHDENQRFLTALDQVLAVRSPR
jgi:histidinol-phosphate aminotransferase